MKLTSLTNKIFAVTLIIGVFGLGYRLGEQKQRRMYQKNPFVSQQNINNSSQQENELDFSLFWQTWDALHEHYLDRKKLSSKQLYYGAIKGMVASVGDNYTYFLTPDENKQSKDDLKGTFSGIGAELGMKNNQIIIVTPLKNSPAAKAGTLPGDIILKVDGATTEGWTIQQAVEKIRGPKGKKVELTLLRKNKKELKLSVVRDEIHVPSIELSFKNNIAVIELTRFGDDTIRMWDQTVRDIVQKNRSRALNGIILDMRGNPGGYLDAAVHIGSEFVPLGTVIVKQEFAQEPTKDYLSEREGKLQNIPVIVLVNEGSASASEIVAGSLRDHKKARLVGEKTFGKGTVQQAVELEDGAGVHVTIARWVLPKGDWINKKGIKPDIEVKNEFEGDDTMTPENDMQLKKAFELLKK